MRVPRWTNQYSIESSGPVIRTSSPVSSPTSRRAVSSVVSPGLGVPLGRVQVRPSRSRRRLPTTSCGSPGLVSDDDPAGGRGGRGPQARHGAVAALGRRPVPARPERAQCIATSGPRPAVRGTARPGRRGSRASRRAGGPADATSGPRSTVGAGRRGRNEPAARRPSRRSRARRRRAHESGRRSGRVLRGDAVLHGPQWYRVSPALQVPRRAVRASAARLRCQRATGLGQVDLPARPRRRTGRGRRARARAAPRGAPRASRRRRGSSGRSARPGCPRARALPSVPSISGP